MKNMADRLSIIKMCATDVHGAVEPVFQDKLNMINRLADDLARRHGMTEDVEEKLAAMLKKRAGG